MIPAFTKYRSSVANNTLSLLHLDGANGATTYLDQAGITWTQQGTCPINTSQFKFGSASLYPNGIGAIITPYSANIDLLKLSAWTVECFVYVTSAPTGVAICSFGGGAIGWNNSTGLHILLQASSGSLSLQVSNGTTTPITLSGTAFILNSWNHLAACLDTTSLRLYLNGALVASLTAPTGIVRPSGNPAGNISGINTLYYWPGYIDEFRISNVARYTGSTYVVPTTSFSYPG